VSSLQELERILVKLINNRLYLDYNATAPLAEAVLQWYAKGALPFGNPSSIHTSGKTSRKFINQTISYLKEYFSLSSHEIFFHSGATEAINSIVKGFCFKHLALKNNFHIISMATDHAASLNQKAHVELLGGEFHTLSPDSNGDMDIDEVIRYISKLDGEVLLNYTYVNSVTGVVSSLEDAVAIKAKTNCLVHVDAVQSIGKVAGHELLAELDFYTFSGHKFGAMKGIGFTFVKDQQCWSPLIVGGSQQADLRSGTENIHGIYSLKLALEELESCFDSEVLLSEKMEIEELLLEKFPDSISIVSRNSKNRNLNTIYLIVNGTKTDILITAFDMAQIDISSGSACSSGSVSASPTLLSMGFSEQEAKNSIRISLPPSINKGDSKMISEKIINVLNRFLKK